MARPGLRLSASAINLWNSRQISRQVAENFGDADDRQVPCVHHRVAARGPHFVSANPKEFERRIFAAQGCDQLRAIHFARGLPGGDENLHGDIVTGAPLTPAN